MQKGVLNDNEEIILFCDHDFMIAHRAINIRDVKDVSARIELAYIYSVSSNFIAAEKRTAVHIKNRNLFNL